MTHTKGETISILKAIRRMIFVKLEPGPLYKDAIDDAINCVDSHADLLEALNEIQRTLTSPSRKLSKSTYKELEPWLPMIQQALNKAEGGLNCHETT